MPATCRNGEGLATRASREDIDLGLRIWVKYLLSFRVTLIGDVTSDCIGFDAFEEIGERPVLLV